MKYALVIISTVLIMAGCVSQKTLRESQRETAAARGDSALLASRVSILQTNISALEASIGDLNQQFQN